MSPQQLTRWRKRWWLQRRFLQCQKHQKGIFKRTKNHMNVLYCFSCVYDVDHDGYNFPPSCQKQIHIPNVKRDDAHMYKGACVRAQHKTLPYGTGAGKGCIITKQMEKGIFLLNKQAAWKAQQQTGPTWKP